MYEHDAPAFAAFGDALHIREGRVVTPGGADAAPIWEAVVEREAARPDWFVRELFGRSDGRVAYLYDIVTHLDPPRARFALGLWMPDQAARIGRFSALVSSVSGSNPEWDIKTHPFARPPDDAALLLGQIEVERSGAPAAPASKLFWDRAFSGADLPNDPARMLKNAGAEGSVDAAWLVEALGDAAQGRAERLDRLGFGQRTFAASGARELPDVLVALRGLVRYRMLMLTLERIGVRAPEVYAAAARQAERLSSLDANRAFVALAQFQSALALTVRLVRVQALDRARAEALVKSLVAVPLDEDGRYRGGIARWTIAALLPAIGGGAADADARLLAALSGTERTAGGTTPIAWEGHQYRVDLVEPERRRLTEVREKLGGPSVALALEVERLATQLAGPSSSLADVKAATAALRTLTASIPVQQKRAALVLPPGVDEPKSPHEILARAVQDLSKISKPKDLRKAARVAEPLSALTDDVLGDALMTWVYALDLGDPAGAPLLAGNVSRRHDFGFTEKDGEQRLRMPWTEPQTDVAPGVPWHVKGSLLGLDLGLASLALRRTTSDPIDRPPVLTAFERDTFSRTVALMNPFEMLDGDRDAIADAIARGRARVLTLARDRENLDQIADAISMDGWRRRAVAWTLAAAPDRVASFFALDDLLTLGGASAPLDAWGVDAGPWTGCFCAHVPLAGFWPLFVGRPARGVLPTQVIDLNLHVALILHERSLPAALAKGVLAAATQDFIDEVRPTDDNDWLTLVRSAQAIKPERMDDYIAGLTANGPLVPWSGTSGRP